MTSQVFEVHLSRGDYVAGLSALVGELARLDASRTRLLFARLALGIVTLLIVAYAFPYSVHGLLASCLLIWLGDSLIQAAFKTQTVGASFDPVAHSNLRVEFGDEAIVEQGELRTRRWTWDAVRRVHLSSGYVIVELKGWDMIVLPDRLWPTPEERKAFVAGLEARRLPGDTLTKVPGVGEAEARVLLVEPVLMARISLAVMAFHLAFEAQLPFPPGPDRTAAFIGLGIASLAGTIAWWASGHAFRRLAARSATAALRTAWTLLAVLAAAFNLWFFGLI
jgi:hypothetical protein